MLRKIFLEPVWTSSSWKWTTCCWWLGIWFLAGDRARLRNCCWLPSFLATFLAAWEAVALVLPINDFLLLKSIASFFPRALNSWLETRMPLFPFVALIRKCLQARSGLFNRFEGMEVTKKKALTERKRTHLTRRKIKTSIYKKGRINFRIKSKEENRLSSKK